MADSEIERARELFLNQLRNGESAFEGHGALSRYWQHIAETAMQSEDIGSLDRWVRDIARDRDLVQSIRDRQAQTSQDAATSAIMAQLLTRLLSLLDEVEAQLRRRLSQLRDQLGSWVSLVGVGNKQKPRPKAIDAETKTEKTAKKEALVAKKPAKKATKKKGG